MNSNDLWRHYLVQHRALESIASAYLAAWANLTHACQAQLAVERQLYYGRKVGEAHEAVCAALEIDRSLKLILWQQSKKRAFRVQRLPGSTVISIAQEITANTEGMSPISATAYEVLVARVRTRS